MPNCLYSFEVLLAVNIPLPLRLLVMTLAVNVLGISLYVFDKAAIKALIIGRNALFISLKYL